MGLGIGVLFGGDNQIVQESVEKEHTGVGGATVQLFQSIGATLGFSIFGSLLSRNITGGMIVRPVPTWNRGDDHEWRNSRGNFRKFAAADQCRSLSTHVLHRHRFCCFGLHCLLVFEKRIARDQRRRSFYSGARSYGKYFKLTAIIVQKRQGCRAAALSFCRSADSFEQAKYNLQRKRPKLN